MPLRPEYRADWERLFAGYAAFYKVPQTPQMRETVWQGIFDPGHEVKALVAVDREGRAAALAHYRAMPRPPRAPPFSPTK
jgi:hypothetical protein